MAAELPTRPSETGTDRPVNRVDGLLASVEPRMAWTWCGLSALGWMAGSWLAGWRVSVPGLQVCAAAVALVGAVLATVSGYVAIRSWILRRR